MPRKGQPVAAERRTLVIISQVFTPDAASMSQHLAEAAAEMARRDWRVLVFTAARSYDDASVRFPARETIDGIEVRRLPASSFGKRSMRLRILASLLFTLQCALRGLFVRRLGGVLVTSSPLAAYGAWAVSVLRRVPLTYWVLDINPDQLIALGALRRDGLPARLLDTLNRMVLRRARDVITLDHFMAERLAGKVEKPLNVHIIPPWSHEDHLEPVSAVRNPFRREHELDDRFVVMYSGNHGLTTTVSTVLGAAARLKHLERLMFLFVGRGYGKLEVERAMAEHGDRNIRSLPFQPLSMLKYSLSAADVHVVTMSDDVVGVIHPSKVYGAMAVGRPLLAIGPVPSPLTELIERYRIGWCVADGDIEATAAAIEAIVACDRAELEEMGRRGRQAALEHFGKSLLCGRIADIVVPSAPAPERRAPSAA